MLINSASVTAVVAGQSKRSREEVKVVTASEFIKMGSALYTEKLLSSKISRKANFTPDID